MFRKIFLVLIIFGLSSGFQKAQAQSGEHEHTHEAVTHVTTKEAENAGNKICPVTGEKIEEETKATYEDEGKIYNFCCTMCIDEFKEDPQKYIKKVEEELQAQSDGEKQEMNAVSDSQKHMEMEGGHHH